MSAARRLHPRLEDPLAPNLRELWARVTPGERETLAFEAFRAVHAACRDTGPSSEPGLDFVIDEAEGLLEKAEALILAERGEVTIPCWVERVDDHAAIVEIDGVRRRIDRRHLFAWTGDSVTLPGWLATAYAPRRAPGELKPVLDALLSDDARRASAGGAAPPEPRLHAHFAEPKETDQ